MGFGLFNKSISLFPEGRTGRSPYFDTGVSMSTESPCAPTRCHEVACHVECLSDSTLVTTDRATG